MKVMFSKTKIPMLRNKPGIRCRLYVKCPVPQFHVYLSLPKSVYCFGVHLY